MRPWWASHGLHGRRSHSKVGVHGDFLCDDPYPGSFGWDEQRGAHRCFTARQHGGCLDPHGWPNFPSNGRIFVCFLSIPHPQDVLIDFIRFPGRAPWYCHVSKKNMLEHRSRCSLSLRTNMFEKRKDPKGWSLRMWFKASWWSPRFSRFQWWWPRSMAGCRPLDRPTADSWGLLTNQRENKEYNGGAPSDVCWFIARMN